MDLRSIVPPPHSSQGSGVLAELYILLVIAFFFLATRLYVAARITQSFDASDITILIAAAFLIANTVFCQLSINHGVGVHLASLPDPEYQALQLRKINTFFQIVNVLTTLFTKYSISLYILRIRQDRTLKIVLGIMMGLMTLATVAVIVVELISCIPLRALWDPSVKGSCLSLQLVYIVSYVQSGFTILVDLGLTASPVVILWNVQIKTGRKVFIVSLMSLGLIATASNAARNAFVPELTSPDFTFDMVPIIALATLEAFAGVIPACVAPSAPLITRRNRGRSSTSSSGIYYTRSITMRSHKSNETSNGSTQLRRVTEPAVKNPRGMELPST